MSQARELKTLELSEVQQKFATADAPVIVKFIDAELCKILNRNTAANFTLYGRLYHFGYKMEWTALDLQTRQTSKVLGLPWAMPCDEEPFEIYRTADDEVVTINPKGITIWERQFVTNKYLKGIHKDGRYEYESKEEWEFKKHVIQLPESITLGVINAGNYCIRMFPDKNTLGVLLNGLTFYLINCRERTWEKIPINLGGLIKPPGVSFFIALSANPLRILYDHPYDQRDLGWILEYDPWGTVYRFLAGYHVWEDGNSARQKQLIRVSNEKRIELGKLGEHYDAICYPLQDWLVKLCRARAFSYQWNMEIFYKGKNLGLSRNSVSYIQHLPACQTVCFIDHGEVFALSPLANPAPELLHANDEVKLLHLSDLTDDQDNKNDREKESPTFSKLACIDEQSVMAWDSKHDEVLLCTFPLDASFLNSLILLLQYPNTPFSASIAAIICSYAKAFPAPLNYPSTQVLSAHLFKPKKLHYQPKVEDIKSSADVINELKHCRNYLENTKKTHPGLFEYQQECIKLLIFVITRLIEFFSDSRLLPKEVKDFFAIPFRVGVDLRGFIFSIHPYDEPIKTSYYFYILIDVIHLDDILKQAAEIREEESRRLGSDCQIPSPQHWCRML